MKIYKIVENERKKLIGGVHMVDLGIDGEKILKYILGNYNVTLCSGVLYKGYRILEYLM